VEEALFCSGSLSTGCVVMRPMHPQLRTTGRSLTRISKKPKNVFGGHSPSTGNRMGQEIVSYCKIIR
jgi:hypothetical protein